MTALRDSVLQFELPKYRITDNVLCMYLLVRRMERKFEGVFVKHSNSEFKLQCICISFVGSKYFAKSSE